MPRTPAWAKEKPERRPANICASWPHCFDPPAEGRRFCEYHVEKLDRVGAALRLAPRFRVPAKPKPEGSPPPKRKLRGLALQQAIVEALKTSGTLTSGELAAAAGTNPKDRTYGYNRNKLIKAGVVVDLGQQGRQRRYKLAA